MAQLGINQEMAQEKHENFMQGENMKAQDNLNNGEGDDDEPTMDTTNDQKSLVNTTSEQQFEKTTGVNAAEKNSGSISQPPSDIVNQSSSTSSENIMSNKIIKDDSIFSEFLGLESELGLWKYPWTITDCEAERVNEACKLIVKYMEYQEIKTPKKNQSQLDIKNILHELENFVSKTLGLEMSTKALEKTRSGHNQEETKEEDKNSEKHVEAFSQDRITDYTEQGIYLASDSNEKYRISKHSNLLDMNEVEKHGYLNQYLSTKTRKWLSDLAYPDIDSMFSDMIALMSIKRTIMNRETNFKNTPYCSIQHIVKKYKVNLWKLTPIQYEDLLLWIEKHNIFIQTTWEKISSLIEQKTTIGIEELKKYIKMKIFNIFKDRKFGWSRKASFYYSNKEHKALKNKIREFFISKNDLPIQVVDGQVQYSIPNPLEHKVCIDSTTKKLITKILKQGDNLIEQYDYQTQSWLCQRSTKSKTLNSNDRVKEIIQAKIKQKRDNFSKTKSSETKEFIKDMQEKTADELLEKFYQKNAALDINKNDEKTWGKSIVGYNWSSF